MKIEVFRSGAGDCLLLTSAKGKRILADAGVPDAYTDFVADALGALRDKGVELDVVYVSHIDRDHIGGVLRMLDTEVAWRVFDHMSKTRNWKQPESARPPEARSIWHNAFFDSIAKTNEVSLGTAGIGQMLGNAAATLAAANNPVLAAEARLLALSVGDAIEVNWRIGSEQLGIALNPEFNGRFMVRDGGKIKLGDLSITVLSPTSTELKELRKVWIAWLKKQENFLESLREQHQRDIDRFDSSSLDRVVEAARSLALQVEKDVTPPNLASLVLLVEEDSRRVLLTGDAGDETILRALDSAGLLDSEGDFEVDVLKVPHHGAHNSFSKEFARRVRARHYIFCGDGEHDNPEHTVVEGYIAARQAIPGSFKLWFNCSRAVAADEHAAHWKGLETILKKASSANSKVKYRFLKSGVKFALSL